LSAQNVDAIHALQNTLQVNMYVQKQLLNTQIGFVFSTQLKPILWYCCKRHSSVACAGFQLYNTWGY